MPESSFSLDIWSWICHLPSSDSWPNSDSPPTLELASSNGKDQISLLLKAEISTGSDGEALVTFSVSFQGFSSEKMLWLSNPFPLSSKPVTPLLHQLIDEVILRSPNSNSGSSPPFQIDAEISSRLPLSNIFNLAFLCHLFWLCVFDGPAEGGSLYFDALSSNLHLLPCNSTLKAIADILGPDGELHFMRSVGYVLSKWLILRELQMPPPSSPPSPPLSFSYGKVSHGFWVLKAFAPVSAMQRVCCNGGRQQLQQDPFERLQAKESLLRYALGHQQLEAVVQLEYSVHFSEEYVEIRMHVDNIRLHVTRLGFLDEFMDERHFPSRVRVWAGPQAGSTYVGAVSLGRSTTDVEREVETQRSVKTSLGNPKFPNIRSTTSSSSTRTRMRSWRWDQDAAGGVAFLEGVLCDNLSGAEVAKWQPTSGGGGSWDPKNGFRRRYGGGSRVFTKRGAVVFARDEYGEEVRWRLGKEVVGRVLRWRLGGKVWLTYWPNEFKTNYAETRCVEWSEEVELPLHGAK